MENFQSKYERAAKRVKELKGFYGHLRAFVIVNAFLYLMRSEWFHSMMPDSFPLEPYYFEWVHANVFLWGVGLMIHGLFVYRNKFPFFKKWEERQIRKYMEEEDEEVKKFRK